MEKLYAGFASERVVLKKEPYVVPEFGNVLLNGYTQLWLDDGTTTLMSAEQLEKCLTVVEEVKLETPVVNVAEEVAKPEEAVEAPAEAAPVVEEAPVVEVTPEVNP